jgi:hypothetical protein
MNSENLGPRIMLNRALDAFSGQTIFSGGSGAILKFLEWLEGLGAKYSGTCKIWGFFWDFC